MQPEAGAIDLWTWDLATSDALGYASDKVSDATNGLKEDAGTSMYSSNLKIPGNPRSGPAYEWDGVEQSATRPDGKTVNIDPGYFLLNKTVFTGDYAKGKTIYHTDATAGCYHCHGENGQNGEATPFASIGFARKYSRQTLVSFASSENHDGNTYWARVQPGNVADLLAYIKGVGGLAGVYLNQPDGSQSDVWTVSNVARAKINASASHTTYQVILVRKLTTLYTDDVQFSLPEGKSYPFGVALMNGDSKNHVGSPKQTLTFKTKTQ
jgi:cytochrome c553